MKTRITLIVIGLVLSISPVFAQSIDDYIEVARDVLHAEKKAVVAEAIPQYLHQSVGFLGGHIDAPEPRFSVFDHQRDSLLGSPHDE